MSNKTSIAELFAKAIQQLQSLDKEELAGRAVDGFVSFMDNLAKLGKSLQTAADWVAINVGGEGKDITDDDVFVPGEKWEEACEEACEEAAGRAAYAAPNADWEDDEASGADAVVSTSTAAAEQRAASEEFAASVYAAQKVPSPEERWAMLKTAARIWLRDASDTEKPPLILGDEACDAIRNVKEQLLRERDEARDTFRQVVETQRREAGGDDDVFVEETPRSFGARKWVLENLPESLEDTGLRCPDMSFSKAIDRVVGEYRDEIRTAMDRQSGVAYAYFVDAIKWLAERPEVKHPSDVKLRQSLADMFAAKAILCVRLARKRSEEAGTADVVVKAPTQGHAQQTEQSTVEESGCNVEERPFQPVTYTALMETLDSIREKDTCPSNENAYHPSCPGWAVFDSSLCGLEVQRCDECARFEGDAEALLHAVNLLRTVYP